MLDGFTETAYVHEGKARPVYRAGSGPAVLVIHEVPGITPTVADFGRRVADAGFTAVLPSLFGTPGAPFSYAAVAVEGAKACVSQEFTAFVTGRTSPITVWLRALAATVHGECGGPGVGVVGMCLTGGFALAMAVDATVVAPVLSQPSLPLGITRAHREDLGVSAGDLATVKRRVDQERLCVLGLRFSEDVLCPGERFESLRRELGDGFVGVELDSGPGNPYGWDRRTHSVLTEELVDEPGHPTHDALGQVLDHLRTRLLPAAG
jgi:dienelactone hydrolase